MRNEVLERSALTTAAIGISLVATTATVAVATGQMTKEVTRLGLDKLKARHRRVTVPNGKPAQLLVEFLSQPARNRNEVIEEALAVSPKWGQMLDEFASMQPNEVLERVELKYMRWEYFNLDRLYLTDPLHRALVDRLLDQASKAALFGGTRTMRFAQEAEIWLIDSDMAMSNG